VYELIAENFGEFFEVPFRAYPADSPYVSAMKSDLERFLDRKRNPLFNGHGSFTYYTVRRNGSPIGRIVAHVHHDSNRRHNLQRSYFGFFDCADDPEAARLLLSAAEEWGRAQACTEIAGNFNLTAMQQMGVVTDGFSGVPYTDMQFNPPHIPALLASNGYERFFPTSTFEIDLRALDPAVMLGDREKAFLESPALRWEPLARRTFTSQLPAMLRILNEGFAQNPMFVPLSAEEFVFQAKEMMWIVDDRIATLAHHGDEPAGVIVCIPDLNTFMRRTRSRLSLATPFHYLRHLGTRQRAVLIFAGVRPQYQSQGLSGAMMYRSLTAMKAAGYTSLGITWVSDENPRSLKQVKKMGGRVLHRLHLFRKSLVAR
jgi:GNAT superfamily N-acetyltransferase